MTLRKWVALNGGPSAVALKLGVTHHAVRVWLKGQGSPTLQMAFKISTLSKCALTMESILKESRRNVGAK